MPWNSWLLKSYLRPMVAWPSAEMFPDEGVAVSHPPIRPEGVARVCKGKVTDQTTGWHGPYLRVGMLKSDVRRPKCVHEAANIGTFLRAHVWLFNMWLEAQLAIDIASKTKTGLVLAQCRNIPNESLVMNPHYILHVSAAACHQVAPGHSPSRTQLHCPGW